LETRFSNCLGTIFLYSIGTLPIIGPTARRRRGSRLRRRDPDAWHESTSHCGQIRRLAAGFSQFHGPPRAHEFGLGPKYLGNTRWRFRFGALESSGWFDRLRPGAVGAASVLPDNGCPFRWYAAVTKQTWPSHNVRRPCRLLQWGRGGHRDRMADRRR